MGTKDFDLDIKIFADGANIQSMVSAAEEGKVDGFTTNPTLMRQAQVQDYESFAKSVLSHIKNLPISFEVFADDFDEMEKQAETISQWGSNVNVKIPICNTHGESSIPLIKRLLNKKVKLNITAVFTKQQIDNIRSSIKTHDNVIVSIFGGRIADTGVDPIPLMKYAVGLFAEFKDVKVLWASPREVINAYQAEEIGCDIITMTPDLIAKLKSSKNKDLTKFSIETVNMFYNDAKKAGYSIKQKLNARENRNELEGEISSL